jgi:hypothetical protein
MGSSERRCSDRLPLLHAVLLGALLRKNARHVSLLLLCGLPCFFLEAKTGVLHQRVDHLRRTCHLICGDACSHILLHFLHRRQVREDHCLLQSRIWIHAVDALQELQVDGGPVAVELMLLGDGGSRTRRKSIMLLHVSS